MPFASVHTITPITNLMTVLWNRTNTTNTTNTSLSMRTVVCGIDTAALIQNSGGSSGVISFAAISTFLKLLAWNIHSGKATILRNTVESSEFQNSLDTCSCPFQKMAAMEEGAGIPAEWKSSSQSIACLKPVISEARSWIGSLRSATDKILKFDLDATIVAVRLKTVSSAVVFGKLLWSEHSSPWAPDEQTNRPCGVQDQLFDRTGDIQ